MIFKKCSLLLVVISTVIFVATPLFSSSLRPTGLDRTTPGVWRPALTHSDLNLPMWDDLEPDPDGPVTGDEEEEVAPTPDDPIPDDSTPEE